MIDSKIFSLKHGKMLLCFAHFRVLGITKIDIEGYSRLFTYNFFIRLCISLKISDKDPSDFFYS